MFAFVPLQLAPKELVYAMAVELSAVVRQEMRRGYLTEPTIDKVFSILLGALKFKDLLSGRLLLCPMTPIYRLATVSRTSPAGSTPLMIACEKGDMQFATFLIQECNADADQLSVLEENNGVDIIQHKVTPFWAAAFKGHANIVRFLFHHGIDKEAVSSTGYTPLLAACYGNAPYVAQILLDEAGANPHAIDPKGRSAMMMVSKNTKLIMSLVGKGGDINGQDHVGNTPLHYAVKEGQSWNIGVLLNKGADVTKTNHLGDDVYRSAALWGQSHAFARLRDLSHPTADKIIEYMELSGCFSIDTAHHFPDALRFWRQALLLRMENNLMLSPDDILPPRNAFAGVTEAITLDQLDELDEDGACMQALVMRERILGPSRKETLYAIIRRACIYATGQHYRRAIDLYKYAFQLCRRSYYNEDTFEHQPLKNICNLFVNLMEEQRNGSIDEMISFEDLMSVF
jgi:ankyrin repeat protein